MAEYREKVQLRYNYRLDPQPRHRAALGKAFGCARVVFNDGLAARHQAREAGQRYVTDAELSVRLTAAKATSERAWLNEVSAVVLQQALADLNTAYRNYFASLTGKRKGPKAGLPRFRSRKDTRQAIRFTANARFKVLPSGKLRLPKIGDVPVRWSRSLPSEPSSVTVIKDSAGRYFASFVVQTGPRTLPGAQSVVGIDLGLKHFAVLSDGRKIASPRFLRRPVAVLGPAARPEHVAGVGAALWCETVRDVDDLTFLLLPRLAGTAEKAWGPAGAVTWPEHRDTLTQHARLWQQDGLTFFSAART